MKNRQKVFDKISLLIDAMNLEVLGYLGIKFESVKRTRLTMSLNYLRCTKKAKGNRVQVILECTEHKDSGMPGTSRYITTKNRKNTTERLELKKYNPILKRVTVHKEIK